VFGGLGLLVSKEVIGFFSSFENKKDAAEVMKYGMVALRYVIAMVFLWLPVLIYGGAFKGAGDTVPPMIVGFLRLALILILPGLAILAIPFENILLATLIAFGIEGFLIYFWYTRRLWVGLFRRSGIE